MSVVEEAVEVRRQAQVLLLEFGTPLPGELHTLDELGLMLTQLHVEELRERRKGPALRNLYLWLRNPSLIGDILENNPDGADAKQLINPRLYNRVLEHAKKLPLRSVTAPYGEDIVTLRSAHPQVEEQLVGVAKAAVYGTRAPLPRVGMDSCDIRVSLSPTNFWVMQPSGKVLHRRTPIISERGLNRVRAMVDAATAYHQPK